VTHFESALALNVLVVNFEKLLELLFSFCAAGSSFLWPSVPPGRAKWRW